MDYVDGLGMDCEEKGHPCRKHVESYRLAEDMGLFLTAHAGEDAGVQDGYRNIWDALELLHVKRIDHGCQTVKDPNLVRYLAEHKSSVPSALQPMLVQEMWKALRHIRPWRCLEGEFLVPLIQITRPAAII